MIQAIIVDDELHCTERLSRLLMTHCSDRIEMTGTFSSIEEAVTGIRGLQPGLVFLDVHLGSRTGFDLLKEFPDLPFRVIFTTAYEQYAVEAFKVSALDYLLKPVEREDLVRAVAKLSPTPSQDERQQQLEILLSRLAAYQQPLQKISIPSLHGLEFIDVNDILRCRSDANYTILYLRNQQQVTVSRTLKEFETLLAGSGFFRIHHSHLVNLRYISKYQKGSGGYVIMDDGTEVEVSARKKEAFLDKMTSFR